MPKSLGFILFIHAFIHHTCIESVLFGLYSVELGRDKVKECSLFSHCFALGGLLLLYSQSGDLGLGTISLELVAADRGWAKVILFYLFIYLFIFSLREITCKQGRGRGRKKILSRLHAQPGARLWVILITLGIATLAEIKSQSDWAPQAPHDEVILTYLPSAHAVGREHRLRCSKKNRNQTKFSNVVHCN